MEKNRLANRSAGLEPGISVMLAKNPKIASVHAAMSQ